MGTRFVAVGSLGAVDIHERPCVKSLKICERRVRDTKGDDFLGEMAGRESAKNFVLIHLNRIRLM